MKIKVKVKDIEIELEQEQLDCKTLKKIIKDLKEVQKEEFKEVF